MSVRIDNFQMKSQMDGLMIDCMQISPEGAVKGIVQLVHGMCEYKERYQDFMTYLAQQGYICIIHDHRGHGKSLKSEEDLGYFYEGGYTALIEDTHQLTMLMKQKYGADKPYILLGHSMGSMVVRCYAKRYDNDINKLVVVGCPSKLFGMVPGLFFTKLVKCIVGEKNHSKIIDYLVIGSMYEKRFKQEGLHAWVCSDKEVVRRYNADPHCNFTFTIQGYENLIQLTMDCYNKKGWKMQNPELPIFFVSGIEDPCAISPKDFQKAVCFMEQRGYSDVTSKLYEGMRHEVLNEAERQKVYEAIAEFMKC